MSDNVAAPVDNDARGETHVTPVKTYLLVGLGLVVITILSLLVPKTIQLLNLSSFDAAFNLTFSLQMALALVKASLIILFYMHVKFEGITLKAFMLIALGIVVVIFLLTFFDILFRWNPDENMSMIPMLLEHTFV